MTPLWQAVYDGIKSAVEYLRTVYTAKPPFLADINRADVPSVTPITLGQLFVFPHLTKHDSTATSDRLRETVVSSVGDLLDLGHAMIHGQEKSGKTALARHLVLSLVDDNQPVLFTDLGTATGRLGDKFLQRIYEDQFNGDYYLWQPQEGKTLVIDNMTDVPPLLDFVEGCGEIFSRILLFVSSDVFYSYLFDEKRVCELQRGSPRAPDTQTTRAPDKKPTRRPTAARPTHRRICGPSRGSCQLHHHLERDSAAVPVLCTCDPSNIRCTDATVVVHHLLRPLLLRLHRS